LRIHEFQAKEIFRNYGIPVPQGYVIENPDEIDRIMDSLDMPVVVKSQVMVGGRGKAGGIKLVKEKKDLKPGISEIIGMKIKGLTVKKVLVEKASDIEKELYAGFVIDRSAKCITAILSSRGGVDIEEVAKTMPSAIIKENIDIFPGLADFKARELAYRLFRVNENYKKFASSLCGILKKLYQIFIDLDCSLVEINPLVITKATENQPESLIALDAKINFDDNALYRQKEVEKLKDIDAEDKYELLAQKEGLNYVHLSGEIGIIGNGAGLVMTTLDVVNDAGGSPANFLDIGGGANAEKVARAVKAVLRDEKVKVLLFNIFGGITRCDLVAEGLLKAFDMIDINVPVVVRFSGTNAREGLELLEQNPEIRTCETMKQAAVVACELVREKEEVQNEHSC